MAWQIAAFLALLCLAAERVAARSANVTLALVGVQGLAGADPAATSWAAVLQLRGGAERWEQTPREGGKAGTRWTFSCDDADHLGLALARPGSSMLVPDAEVLPGAIAWLRHHGHDRLARDEGLTVLLPTSAAAKARRSIGAPCQLRPAGQREGSSTATTGHTIAGVTLEAVRRFVARSASVLEAAQLLQTTAQPASDAQQEEEAADGGADGSGKARVRWRREPSAALRRSGMFDEKAPCAEHTLELTGCVAHHRGDVSACRREQRSYMRCSKRQALGDDAGVTAGAWSASGRSAAEASGATAEAGSQSAASSSAARSATVRQAERVIERATRGVRPGGAWAGSSLGGSYADSPTQAAEDAEAASREIARQGTLQEAAHTLQNSPQLQRLADELRGLGGPSIDQELLSAVGAPGAAALAGKLARKQTVGLPFQPLGGLPQVVPAPGLQGGMKGAAAGQNRESADDGTRFRTGSQAEEGAVVAADTSACVLHGTCPPAAFKLPPISVPSLPYFLPVAIGPFGPNLADAAGMIIGAVIHGVAGPEIIQLVQQFVQAMMTTIPPILRMVLVEGLIPALPPMPRMPDLNAIAARMMAMLAAMKLKAEAELRRILAGVKLQQMRLKQMLAGIQGALAQLMGQLKASMRVAAKALLAVKPMALQLRTGAAAIAAMANKTALAVRDKRVAEARERCDTLDADGNATQADKDACLQQLVDEKDEAASQLQMALDRSAAGVARAESKAQAAESRAREQAESVLRASGVVPEGSGAGTAAEVLEAVAHSAEEEGWADEQDDTLPAAPTPSEVKALRARIARMQQKAAEKLREIGDMQQSAVRSRRAWEAVALREQEARRELELTSADRRDDAAYRAMRSGGYTWRWGAWRDGEGRGLGPGGVGIGNAGSGVEAAAAERERAQRAEAAYATVATGSGLPAAEGADAASAAFLQREAASARAGRAEEEEVPHADDVMAAAAAPHLLDAADAALAFHAARNDGDGEAASEAAARRKAHIRSGSSAARQAMLLQAGARGGAGRAADSAEAGASTDQGGASLLQAGGSQRNGVIADIVATQTVSKVTVTAVKVLTQAFSRVISAAIYDSVTGEVSSQVKAKATSALVQGASRAAMTAVHGAVAAGLERAMPPLLRRSVTRSAAHSITRSVSHSLVHVLPRLLAAPRASILCCHDCIMGNGTGCDCCPDSSADPRGANDVPASLRWWEWSAPDAPNRGGLYPPPPPQGTHAVAEAEAEDVVSTLTSAKAMGAVEEPPAEATWGVGKEAEGG